MKDFGKSLAYLGTILLAVSTFFAIRYALAFITAPKGIWINPPLENWAPYQYMLFTLVAGIPGMLLMLIGIHISRPRYMWIILNTLGILYCIAVGT